MKPTMKLRWVVRQETGHQYSVLQQWWEYPPPRPLGMPGPIGEWRDISLEVEG